jgi:CheY-like chemotaxis protein
VLLGVAAVSRLRVLVVEDDPSFANRLLWGLEADGHAVTVAGSIEEGAPHLSSADVVLLDLILPGLQGEDAVMAWRQRAGVVALSGDTDRLAGVADWSDVLVHKSTPSLMSSVREAVALAHRRYLDRKDTDPDPAPSSPLLPGVIGAAADRADRAIGRVEDPGQRNALRVTLAILMLVVVMFGVVWAAARVASADCREDVLYWRSRYEHLVEALLAKDTALGIELLDEVSDAACAHGDCGRALTAASR